MVLTLSIFRLGRDENTGQEEALALMLVKNYKGDYQFDFDRFIIPKDFPDTETYRWEEIDVSLSSRLSEIKNYPGYYYPAKDKDAIKERFGI